MMGYIINGMYGDLFLISLFFFVFVLHLLADAADRLASCVSGLSFTRVFVCVCVCVVSVGSRCEPTCVCVCRVKTANRAAHKSVPSSVRVTQS